MKSVKLTLLIITIFGLFFIQMPQAYAGGGGPDAPCPSCMAINPGAGALALKGTLALVYSDLLSGGTGNLDITLRLERSSDIKFFRLHLVDLSLNGLNDGLILCTIFNPGDSGDQINHAAVTEFVTQILNSFFPGKTVDDTRLVITPSSLSDYQGSQYCLDNDCNIPGTNPTLVSTLGDVTVFAVDSASFRPYSCH